MFIHELAHNLAGLGDEYVGSVTYETGAPVKAEPWEPNITALHDPSALKWRDLVEPGTAFADADVATQAKLARSRARDTKRAVCIGRRPPCIMGSRTVVDFCRVCQRAINRIIDLHTN